MRSKAQWAEEGEKSSSYFLNLEKKNYLNKCISRIHVEGNIITDPDEILLEEKKIYSKLYADNARPDANMEELKLQLLDQDFPKLTEEESESCEVNIDEKTCAEALSQMKNGKTPGIDGLPVEFYKFFWQNLKHLIVGSIGHSFHNEHLSANQKYGILTLIPKKDKDRTLLKNWRPLTLLTTDYKIITKILSMHIAKVLPNIINGDQSGYLKGRYAGENIRTITDIIEYCKQKNMTGVLLLIDFEKAFDTVKWDFLHDVLRKFKFGNKFRKWVKILYSDVRSYIVNNGHFSPLFQMFRGIRQGCPLSAYLFLLIVEILAISVRNSKNIKGIKLTRGLSAWELRH